MRFRAISEQRTDCSPRLLWRMSVKVVVMSKSWKLSEDPTRIAFNRAHCVDEGVDAGGWGAVVVELRVEKS